MTTTYTTRHRLRSQPWPNFVRFARHMIASRDIDPLYPVLRELVQRTPDHNSRHWLIVLYVAYYNLPSAYAAWCEYPFPDLLPDRVARLPINMERRGLRGGENMRDHIASWYCAATTYGLASYLGDGLDWDLGASLEENYAVLWDRLKAIRFNGRWAAFKTAEVLQQVYDYPVAAPDMKLADGPGPRGGLRLLTDGPLETEHDMLQASRLVRTHLTQDYGPVSWEVLETLLCNWKNLCEGRYYVGHDIDELQAQIVEHRYLATDQKEVLMLARRNALPIDYLGEVNGWCGVDKELTKYYADLGHVVPCRKDLNGRMV